MSDSKDIKFKGTTTAISEVLAKGLTIGKDGIAVLSEDAIEAALPEGVTLESIKVHHDLRDALIAGSLHALGDPAINALKKDKKLDSVSLSFKVANDTVSHVVERSRLTGMPGGEKKEQFGFATSKYEVQGSSKNRGELKKVHTLIKSLAAEAALG